MNNSSAPDWSLLHVLLEVAQAGSLSHAARNLGRSQATLSRQIAQLEAQMGQALFERSPRGVRLTSAASALIPSLERMKEQALTFSQVAAGQSSTLAGTVRLTASETVSAYVLPRILQRLRAAHPEIQIELVASNEVENLLEREADIAVRMVRPQQSALIARRLADIPLGLFAHRDYLQQHGVPTADNLFEHQWIGFDRSDQMIRGFRDAGFVVDKRMFGLRCDNQIVAWQAVLAGMGIGVTMDRVAALSPDVVRVLSQVPIPPLPVWLTTHREWRGSPRLKLVFETLASALGNP